ncbi:hypothetical protein ACLBSX_24030, partial [Pseudomonas aeruginosa]
SLITSPVSAVRLTSRPAMFGDQYKDVVAFGLLILVLLFRPTGILGRPEVEKV